MPLNTFVGPTAVEVYIPTAAPGVPSVTLVNAGTSVLYLGGPDITQTSGMPFQPRQTIQFPVAPSNIWALCGSTTTTPNTTLSAAAAVGATSITVTSATGFSIGETITIGTAPAQETAVITNIVSTTFTLSVGLEQDHASGDAVHGTAASTTSLGGGTISAYRGIN